MSYWRSYREIRSNVREHMDFVYNDTSENDQNNCSEGNQSNVTSDDIVGEAACDRQHNEILQINSDQNLDDSTLSFDDISDTSSSEESIDDIEIDLKDKLAGWVTKFSIPHTAVYELLHILSTYHDFLPKDPRTLLRTKKVYEISEMNGGSYHHFGISAGLKKILLKEPTYSFCAADSLSIQINIDGLPLFKSSNTQFWPILGRLVEPFSSEPFVIGLYVGNSKPGDVNAFLHDFVEEMQYLEQNLLHVEETNQYLKVNLSAIICDAPAKAYVKQIKGHSGYHGCDKCMQKGCWKGKMTFPLIDSPLRTDFQFNELSSEGHHLGRSPLMNLSIGMVSQFPLDYMHLVCLGVVKRLLLLWMRGPMESNCRIAARSVALISEKLIGLQKYLPREFLRKGRPLNEIDRWKATELRQFLLYTGPCVLFSTISRSTYKHFMLLFVAIYCLSSPFYCSVYCNYANDLLHLFVHDFARIYGQDTVVYNVHNLVHLAGDVEKHGVLDNFSAFIFESFLGKLKRLVRKPNFPLQQVIRRLSENSNWQPNKRQKVETSGVVKKNHINGPISLQVRLQKQYKELQLKEVYFSVKTGDNCILVGDKVGLIRNIVCESTDKEKSLIYEEFGDVSNFFDIPLLSSDLRIFVVSGLTGEMKVTKACEVFKCVLLPFQEKFLTIPLLHTL